MAKMAQGEALAQEAAMLRKLGLQIAELQGMGLADLRAEHVALFGEEARSKNLPFLRRRLAFRLQERVQGGLSSEVKERLEELAPSELPAPRRVAIRPAHPREAKQDVVEVEPRDPRLPEAGTILRREHRGFVHEIEVLDRGFRYRGRDYRSLSAIAKEITGTAWNGFGFFGLMKGAGHGEK